MGQIPWRHKRRFALYVLGIVLSCQCFAQVAHSTVVDSRSHAASRQLTAEDLTVFFDDRVPQRLEAGGIAGAVVIVVKDGRILFSKGYGFADVRSKRPMSPDETIVRFGSISKLFTWTAVMQQVERGNLDLDQDVNDYLDFRIPDTFAQPITLRHIMTHTSGFEETLKQLGTYKPERLISLESYVKNDIPVRIYPPGEVVSYSNYAASLAGYIVQRVSHMQFASYISNEIFAPLGMTRSTFVQPLPPSWRGQMSSSYVVATQSPQPYELTNASPSGAAAGTGSDIARFMIAHLQDGEFHEAHILKPATAQRMHQHARSEVPGFGGFALGFMDQTCNGHHIIGHPGSTLFWRDELRLVPDADIGFFVSLNSTGRLGSSPPLLEGLFHEFATRYLGCAINAQSTVPTVIADSQHVAGQYLSSRRPEGSFFRLLNLLSPPVVTSYPDGSIEMNVIRAGATFEPIRWREVAPLVYQEEDGFRRLAFVQDTRGHISFAALDADPTFVYLRAPEKERWTGWSITISVSILALSLILGFVAFLVRNYTSAQHADVQGPYVRWRLLAARLAPVACLLWLITFLAWGNLILTAATDLTTLSEPLTMHLYVLYTLTVASMGGTLVIVAKAVLLWSQSNSRLQIKLGNTVVALASLYTAWFAIAFHLTSFRMVF